MATRAQYEGYLNLPQVKAALDTIAWAEGANYNTLFGGGTFTGNQHPNKCITYKNTCSTAAGRYQFLFSTWKGLNLPDFSPRNQDIGALMLMDRRGSLAFVLSGNFEGGLRHGGLGKEWASLPFSPYGQPQKTLTQVLNYFNGALAVYGGSANVSMLPMASGGISGVAVAAGVLILVLLITE